MTFTGKSQVEINSSFRDEMNTIFGPLDKSKVPYGLLRDYAMEFTNLEFFNGTASLADSNQVTTASFYLVYNTLVSSRIHSSASGFVTPDTLENRWYSYRDSSRITLAGLFFNYARFKDNAYPNYITISSNKLYDKYVSGVWQNPYQDEKAFAISPSVTDYPKLSFNVLLPSNCWLSNTSHAGIAINFNDGLGYRSITPGTALSVSYSAGGTKEWIYRLALSGGGYLYSHSFVRVAVHPGS